MSPPKVSVVIPHYNDLKRLDACLSALERQTYPREDFEIVVADNRSPVGLAAVEATVAGRARIVDAPTPGAGPARNAGVLATQAPLLAFTDCDCVPEPEWLTEGLKALETADFVGGRMFVLFPQGRAKNGAEAFEAVFAFDNRSYVLDQRFTVTANLFCPRSLFDAVGEFHTEVSEDKEWCLRAGDLGYRIGYAERASVGHPARENWPQLRKKWERLNSESYALWRQRGSSRLGWLIRTWALLPSIPIHGLRVLTSPALNGMGERLAALGTLARSRLWRFVDSHRLLLRSPGSQA